MAQHDENVVWHAHPVTQQQREQHHGHRGVVLWFTGLSGSGKSTVAGALEEALHERGVSTYLLDGDNVRHGLCSDLGFSDEDRKENIRRVGEVAKADGRCRAGGIDGIYITTPRGTADGARAPGGGTLYRSVRRYPAGHLRGAGSERIIQEGAGRGITQFHRHRLGL